MVDLVKVAGDPGLDLLMEDTDLLVLNAGDLDLLLRCRGGVGASTSSSSSITVSLILLVFRIILS